MLDPAEQTLLTPRGIGIPLTGAEHLLLTKLLDQLGKPVSRAELCDELGPGGDPENTRRLDSLISRLRSKVLRQSGVALPVRALRNVGYVFGG